jgi:hypothetical protein
MAEIQPLLLDLLPTYIPFTVQCSSTGSAAMNPSVDSLIIYEDNGTSSVFAATTITGSPFDPAQINSQTGLWGVKIAKSLLTAGKYYIAYWEMTIDEVAAAKVEVYFATNASNFKADVSAVATEETALAIKEKTDKIRPRNGRIFGMPG